ncbi:tetratricopeptide repeat protein [Sphingopyxis indica]|uniref:Ancillary SecYEG translocon subunit/Cell division coordinator CpoB TPR domain-containing protein n=1 Tax=Sphingopyxis indica TaxID=436663 RepID=A0A239H0M8_9SPHN|nr:tetratricopeptide repeat protein [Sphingopyxis indica]SNS74940.1 hypothetical protein SAMN06295955_104192 [Sphingopyxis indica]
MALSPTNNAALLQEVDEAVRRDRLDSIWKSHGRLIVAAVVAALLAFGGYLFWQHRQNEARGERAEALVAALDKLDANQPRGATADLEKIAAGDDAAYRSIALIQQANMQAEKGDMKGAAALVAKVAADQDIDPALRNMALVRQTAFELGTIKPETVIARMKPLVDAKDPASPWFASAAELTAIAHYKLGQFDQAGALYGRIAKLPDIPKSLQSRSVQMAGMLGVDAVADRADDSAAKDRKGEAAPKAAAAAKSEEVQ